MSTVRNPLPHLLVALALLALVTALSAARPGTAAPARPGYAIGTPVLTELWVDPVNGRDTNSGATRGAALRTLTAAWDRVPVATPLGQTGYRILLVRGVYPEAIVPLYWERRYGTYRCPVIIEAADGPGTAVLPNVNVFDCRYFYLIGLRMTSGGGDVLHYEACDHVLVRQCQVVGTGNLATYDAPQEAFKANQTRHLYVEDSDISGGWDNAVDGVAVHYGHFLRNRIHRATEWGLYLKGGSAYFLVEGNEFFDVGTGGFSAGQGSGMEFMASPWLHYEAYDIKFVNNVVHDIEGAGFGVNGGYNILIAYNTAYRVGRRSHGLEFVHGIRTCDGGVAACRQRLAAGGWGTDIPEAEEPIGNRNIFVYNNILLNPDDYHSEEHFAIHGPRTATPRSNIPSPVRADVNLQIRGNLIWNGPADLPLGVGGDRGGQPDNPICNAEQLRRENTINTVRPELVDPARGDFRPVPGGNVFSAVTYAIPGFSWGDAPARPLAPAGNLDNTVAADRDGAARVETGPPGAHAGGASAVFTASGRVTAAGAGLAGVTLAFARIDGEGDTPAPVLTDARGYWRREGFAAGAQYRVTPSLTGESFQPASRDFRSGGASLDFQAARAAVTYAVSGRVRSRRKSGIAGVRLLFSRVSGGGAVPGEVRTDAAGRWQQEGFATGSTYRVRPVFTGYRFAPRDRRFGQAATLNFTGRKR